MAPKMSYVRLGNSGLKVSKMILGCMSFGDPAWEPWCIGEDEAIKIVKYAYDHGIIAFDTANVYSNGLSEIILGNCIKKLNLPREEIVVMTKLWSPVADKHGTNLFFTGKTPEEVGIINQKGLSRKHIFDGVKASLKRLQVDYIDVLQCHRADPDTPIAETMQALHDVVQAGYVRYIGMSSCWAYQFHAMQNYAITHNLTPFIMAENHYSLLYREDERELIPTLKMFNVGSTPWSPLGRGLLTRPVTEDSLRKKTDIFQGVYNIPFLPTLTTRIDEIAKKRGKTMAQIAMAWVLSKPWVSAPIIGATKLSNIEGILDALEITLTEEEVKYLEEPYQPVGIIGHF
ncbi:Aldo/keto reductase [Fomes fomentarius]|nr:Aldo/keto reductase [Fomes fomentarius]